MKSNIEQAKATADKFEREGNLGKVAEIRYGTLNELEHRMRKETEELALLQKPNKMLKEEVDAERYCGSGC